MKSLVFVLLIIAASVSFANPYYQQDMQKYYANMHQQHVAPAFPKPFALEQKPQQPQQPKFTHNKPAAPKFDAVKPLAFPGNVMSADKMLETMNTHVSGDVFPALDAIPGFDAKLPEFGSLEPGYEMTIPTVPAPIVPLW